MKKKVYIAMFSIITVSILFIGCPDSPGDLTAPTAGGSGTLTSTSLIVGGLTLSWTAATDESIGSLSYRLVSASTSAAIDTAAEINDITSAAVLNNWTESLESAVVTGLSPKITMFLNVAVKDVSGNMVAYTPIEVTSLPDKLYLFRSAYTHGDLVNRAGTDNWVDNSSEVPSGVSKTVALLSIDANDQLKDIPANHSFPSNVPIYGPDGLVKIADDWADLMDGTIDADLVTAGVCEDSKFTIWWSGSTSNGSVSDSTCNSWTEGSGVYYGTIGDGSSTNTNWITYDTPSSDSEYIYLIGLGY